MGGFLNKIGTNLMNALNKATPIVETASDVGQSLTDSMLGLDRAPSKLDYLVNASKAGSSGSFAKKLARVGAAGRIGAVERQLAADDRELKRRATEADISYKEAGGESRLANVLLSQAKTSALNAKSELDKRIQDYKEAQDGRELDIRRRLVDAEIKLKEQQALKEKAEIEAMPASIDREERLTAVKEKLAEIESANQQSLASYRAKLAELGAERVKVYKMSVEQITGKTVTVTEQEDTVTFTPADQSAAPVTMSKAQAELLRQMASGKDKDMAKMAFQQMGFSDPSWFGLGSRTPPAMEMGTKPVVKTTQTSTNDGDKKVTVRVLVNTDKFKAGDTTTLTQQQADAAVANGKAEIVK